MSADIDELRAALREYIDHDLSGVHIEPKDEGLAGYESCEHLHYRLGALAFPEKAAEYAALQRARPSAEVPGAIRQAE